MRRLLGAVLATALVLLAVPVALAADKGGPPVFNEIVPPVAPAWNRTGAYVGLVAGYNAADLGADSFKFADTAVQGGIAGGFNVRVDGIVLGMEADFVLNKIRGNFSSGGTTVQADADYLASARVRAGLPVGPALIYATAGLAGSEKTTVATTGMTTSVTKDFQFGGVFGAGVEVEVTKTLFVRLEGLHYVFPDQTAALGFGSFFASKDQETSVRLGVGFKLN